MNLIVSGANSGARWKLKKPASLKTHSKRLERKWIEALGDKTDANGSIVKGTGVKVRFSTSYATKGIVRGLFALASKGQYRSCKENREWTGMDANVCNALDFIMWQILIIRVHWRSLTVN